MIKKSKFSPLMDIMIVKALNEKEYSKPIVQACVTSSKMIILFKKPISGKQVLSRYYKIRSKYEKI